MNSASLCSLAGRYDNPLPPRFLAPIDSLKIPALAGGYDNPILSQFLAPIDSLKIPAQELNRDGIVGVLVKNEIIIAYFTCFLHIFSSASCTQLNKALAFPKFSYYTCSIVWGLER
jgi:hypothetical protein